VAFFHKTRLGHNVQIMPKTDSYITATCDNGTQNNNYMMENLHRKSVSPDRLLWCWNHRFSIKWRRIITSMFQI